MSKTDALKAVLRTPDPSRMCLQQQRSAGAVVLLNQPEGSWQKLSYFGGSRCAVNNSVFSNDVLDNR
ncbi:MAG: hypothetical protein NZ837_06255 [Gammaproteobacteria bacterium]|jgi:hypothetical protein|nr:hypothetical protein [Gammaproteobacteria bacterium]